MVSKIEPNRYADTGFSVKDTSPEINAMIFRHAMSLTPGERFVMGMSLFATARALVWSGIPRDLPESERRRAFYERFYGEPGPDVVANWQSA